MFDNWLFLTLLVTISIGIVAFTNKVFAEKQYDVRFSALVLYIIMFLISLWLWYFQWFVSLWEIGALNIALAVIWGMQFYGYSFVMMSALRYLPTSTYFISVRLSSSFILLGIGLLFFWDNISFKEIIWFILWIWAMSMLFEKSEASRADFKKWILFLLLWIFFLVLGHSITKILSFDLEMVPTLLAIAFWSALCTASIFGYKQIQKHKQDISWIMWVNIIQSFFFFVYFYFLFQVYNLWDLWISYKIQSYSPFIPIILWALIYREKISFQKTIGIILTALSLYFFT